MAPSSAALSQALRTVPPGSAVVEFSDEAAKLRRWNITRPVRAADAQVLQRYAKEADRYPTAVDGLLPSLVQVMLQDNWGWSFLDVDWSVLVTGGGAPFGVIKLRDTLDMATVMTSLKQRYSQTGPANRPPTPWT